MAKKLLIIAFTGALLAGNLTIKAEEVELTEPTVQEEFEEITCPASEAYEIVTEEAAEECTTPVVEEEAVTEESVEEATEECDTPVVEEEAVTEEAALETVLPDQFEINGQMGELELTDEEITELVSEEKVVGEVEPTEEELALEAERLEQIAKEEAEQAEREALALLREEKPHLAQFISRSKPTESSLFEAKPNLFRNWHFCVVDSVSNPKGTELKFFNPDISSLTTARIAKNEANPSRGEWTNAKVLRKTDRAYSANLKFDNKYVGYRDKAFGILFEAIMGLRQTYNGTILVDEWFPLWNVTLKDRAELFEFVSYLKTNLEKQVKTNIIKPVLFLKLADDPSLATLTEEDFTLVSSIFELIDPSDEKVAKSFNDILNKVNDTLMKFESGNARKPGRGLRQQTMDKFESLFSDFDPKDATMKGAGWGADKFVQAVIVAVTLKILSNPVERYMREKGPKTFAWFKGLFKKPATT